MWVVRLYVGTDLGLGQGGVGTAPEGQMCPVLEKAKKKQNIHKETCGHRQAKIIAAKRGARGSIDKHKKLILSSLSSTFLLDLGLCYCRLIQV